MIRIVDAMSGAAIAGAVLALVVPHDAGLSPLATVGDTASAAAVAVAPPFHDFPPGVRRTVRFSVRDPQLDSLTPREVADQRRDWLLLTALQSAGLSPASFDSATFDRPPVRYAFMDELGAMEYGPTRSAFAGQGMVVALVPAGLTAAARSDALGAIADGHRKNLGQAPDSLVVFEYDLAPGGDSAQLWRAPAVKGADLYTAAAGYRELMVSSAAELGGFLHAVDDLTYAALDGDGLRLGGRKLLASGYRGVTVEDVAALWKSSRDAAADSDPPLQGLPSDTLVDEPERGSYQSGFSLDPVYDYQRLAVYFDSLVQAGCGPRSSSDAATIRIAIASRDSSQFEGWLRQLDENGEGTVARYIVGDRQRYMMQHARYDGGIQGTRVAMTLFYTDLIAKLWALNFMGSTPTGTVADFTPMTRRIVSPVYRAQIDSLNSTRLWFEPEDAGFQPSADNQSLLFARRATRVSAKSRGDLQAHASETGPNARSQQFIGWWNDHYEDVAAYEPEYQRLNEIEKWSLVVSWLTKSGQGDRLGYLEPVHVERSLWFPRWAAANPALRFRGWSDLPFKPRGYDDSTTESLDLLSTSFSRWGEMAGLMGGVSLGSEEAFASERHLRLDVPPVLRRSELDPSIIGDGPGHTTRFPHYDLGPSGSGGAGVAATPGATARFRQWFGDLVPGVVKRFNRSRPGLLELAVETERGPLGAFTARMQQGRIEAVWEAQDVAEAQWLSERVSVANDPEALLRADPGLSDVYRLSDGGHLVRCNECDKWVKIAEERGGSIDPPGGWFGRASAENGRPQLFTLFDDQDAAAELRKPGVVKVRSRPEAPAAPKPPFSSVHDAAMAGAKDPRKLKAARDVYLAALGRSVHALLRDGRADEAIRRVREAESVFGTDPRVRLWGAAANLQAGDTPDAARLVRMVVEDRQAWSVLDEMVAWGAVRPAHDDESLQAITEYLVWGASARAPRGTMELVQDADGTLRNVFVPGHEIHLDPERVLERPAGDFDLYVQDAPGPGNHDWSADAAGPRLNETLAGGLGELHEIPEGDLGGFSPDELYASPRRETKYRRLNVPRAVGIPIGANGCGDDGESRARSRSGDCRRHAYVLVLLPRARA